LRVLITEDFHPILEDELKRLGLAVTILPKIDYQGVCEIVEGFEILIVNSKIRIDQNLLSKAKSLKIIGRIGSGRDIFDEEACQESGIITITTPEGNANAVAEHVLGFILSTYNNVSKAHLSILNGEWSREENRGRELNGKTLAIIGFGHNGQRLAELLAGFDVHVLANDILPIQSNLPNVSIASMEEIYLKADIVSLHVPLIRSTIGFASHNFFNSFQNQIDFVNCSRGKVAPWKPILDHLQSSKIRTAMLDVFEDEPLSLTDEILKFSNQNRLFLTPHIAGWTVESRLKLAQQMATKIKKHL
jgi:D-3-phosphoglycerate dehydrogenase / 2-oxoglutarate reductase